MVLGLVSYFHDPASSKVPGGAAHGESGFGRRMQVGCMARFFMWGRKKWSIFLVFLYHICIYHKLYNVFYDILCLFNIISILITVLFTTGIESAIWRNPTNKGKKLRHE